MVTLINQIIGLKKLKAQIKILFGGVLHVHISLNHGLLFVQNAIDVDTIKWQQFSTFKELILKQIL